MVGTTMLALSLLGTGLGAYGQIKAGQAAKKAGDIQQDAANAQADVVDLNAATAAAQAADATARGTVEEQRFRTGIRGILGSQIAGFAGNNVDVHTGSAVDVQADAALLGELDALQIRNNAAREAWGYAVESEDLTQRAAVTRKEGVAMAAAGRQQASAATWGAAAGVLSGTTSALAARYGMASRS